MKPSGGRQAPASLPTSSAQPKQAADPSIHLERTTGVEPVTFALATRRSTSELRPHADDQPPKPAVISSPPGLNRIAVFLGDVSRREPLRPQRSARGPL